MRPLKLRRDEKQYAWLPGPIEHRPDFPLAVDDMASLYEINARLSDEDIEKMVKDAEENAESDKAKKDLVEARNGAESLIHSTEKSMEEHGDKVDPTTIEAIELAIANLKEQLETDDAGKIRGGIQNVTEASMKLGEAIYKAQAEQTGDADPEDSDEGPRGVDDDIVDADFEDLSDDDKRA